MTTTNEISPQLQRHTNQVSQILDRCKQWGKRVRLFYGNPLTGEQWLEEYNIMGYVGKSAGPKPICILLNNSSSSGGTGILVSSVIKITIDKKPIFQVPSYQVPDLKHKKLDKPLDSNGHKLQYGVFQRKADGQIENVANFKTEEDAKKYIDFQQGRRNKVR